MKKNLASKFLATSMIFASLFGSACSGGGKNDDSKISNKIPGATETVTDAIDHFITENTLHEVSVDFTNKVGDFVKNSATEYEIVVAESYTTAATFLAKHVLDATGAIVKTTTLTGSSSTIDASKGKYIIFGVDSAMESAGIEMPARSELGNAGYYIKTVGDDVYIGCYTTNGAQMAAIAFLNEVLGYDMLAEDLVVYEKDGSVLPQMEIKERPDYDYRINSNTMGASAIYGMGFTTASPILSVNGSAVHNFYYLLDSNDVENHPKWFSEGARISKTATYNLGQPCFTAHGDKEEYQAMISRVYDTLVSQLQTNDTVSSVRITLNDVLNLEDMNTVARCTCDACNASYEYYGSVAGSMVSFANDLSEKLQAWIAANQTGREFEVVVLAYGQALNAPTKKDSSGKLLMDENGKGVPLTRRDFDENGNGTDVVDEDSNPVLLTCADGVAWEYACSSANWIHSFYDDENATYASYMNAWAGLGGTMYVWAYEINYYNYLYPYNNYDIMIENYRYFKSLNASYMYSEGTWENKNNSGFAKFRDYINSKALFDVNVNYAELKEKFFTYYFGDAKEYMLQFFDEVVLNLKNNESITGGSVHSDELTSTSIWTQTFIEHYLDLFDEAYAAIEKYKTTNADLYEAYTKHILIESMFPRYVLLTEYESSIESTSELYAMRQQYADDFDNLGNTTDQEHYTIRGEGRLFATWGV